MTAPVFYSGFGFIPVALLVLSGIVDLIFGLDTKNETVMGIGIAVCGILTGIACLILKFHSRFEHIEFRLVSTKHNLMFLPVFFWCPILLVIGISKLI